jgi:rhodanese-related sulfurtransferase
MELMLMSKIVKLAAVALLLGAPLALTAAAAQDKPQASAPAYQYKAKSPKLKRADIDALLAKPDQLLIIDVRRPDEQTAKGSFPVFLSVQAKDLESRLAFIPKDRTIITVSNHAGRAGTAADYLADHGFKVAGAAGIQDYEAEGGAIVKIAPPAPKQQ